MNSAQFEIDENTCPICLEIMYDINKAVTNCGHHFHLSCLAMCLKINNTCPLCRQDMFNNEVETKQYFNDVDESYGDDFQFPEIPDVHIINGQRLFIKDGYLYLNIECIESECIAQIYEKPDGSFDYDWFNNVAVVRNNLVIVEDGELIEQEPRIYETENAQREETDDEMVSIFENILFTRTLL